MNQLMINHWIFGCSPKFSDQPMFMYLGLSPNLEPHELSSPNNHGFPTFSPLFHGHKLGCPGSLMVWDVPPAALLALATRLQGFPGRVVFDPTETQHSEQNAWRSYQSTDFRDMKEESTFIFIYQICYVFLQNVPSTKFQPNSLSCQRCLGRISVRQQNLANTPKV